MKYGKSMLMVSTGLVAGLALGSVGMAAAATPAPTRTATTQAAGAAAGYGLRLGAAMRDAGARMVDVVAKATGLTVTDVAAKRAAGTSYAAIAQSKGVSSDKVVADALAARKAILDQRVKAGSITADTEKTILDRMSTNMKSNVTATGATRGSGSGSCDGTGGGGGMGRGSGGGGGMGRGSGNGNAR
jgi:hypothetical protein